MAELLEACRVKRIEISAYHPQSNGLVERGHDAIINSLSKYCKGQRNEWFKYLPLALWADRISVRRSTGYSAFRLLYGRECILPVEFAVSSWSMVDWQAIESREDLLTARIKQLDRQSLEEALAAEALKMSRLGSKAYFDAHKQMRPLNRKIEVGDLVLVHNTRIQKSWDKKLDDNWFGPYRVREVTESSYYRLAELDGVELRESVAGNRLKLFFARVREGDGARGAGASEDDDTNDGANISEVVSQDSGVTENGSNLDEF